MGARSLAILLFLVAAAAPALGADAERGRQLYEQRCTACHTQSVHKREGHKARDYNEVREWVQRWNEVFNFRWDDEAIEDVTFFLNSTIYLYAVPA
jgi:mono/diheme cytochrome c family protein